MNTIPKTLKKFFWDTQFSDINPDNNRDYIIGRLLRLGDDQSWKWLKQTYSSNQIKQVVKNSRELTPKDAALFCLVYKLDLSELKCTKRA